MLATYYIPSRREAKLSKALAALGADADEATGGNEKTANQLTAVSVGIMIGIGAIFALLIGAAATSAREPR